MATVVVDIVMIVVVVVVVAIALRRGTPDFVAASLGSNARSLSSSVCSTDVVTIGSENECARLAVSHGTVTAAVLFLAFGVSDRSLAGPGLSWA